MNSKVNVFIHIKMSMQSYNSTATICSDSIMSQRIVRKSWLLANVTLMATTVTFLADVTFRQT